MSSELLAVRAVHFAYPDGPAVLAGVDFSVAAGELFGVVGPNGSGKSTLLSLCCGLLTPQAGRIEVLGRPTSQWSRRALSRRVALVPQGTTASFPFTVLEMVLMGRAPHLGPLAFEGTEDLEAAQRAMHATGIAHLGARPLGQISGGERQRVLIARALAQSPELLVCDEPTAHLDLRHRTNLLDLLRVRTREDGLGVVVVFHDLNLAAVYCDRLLLLDAGKIRSLGSVDEVLSEEHLQGVYGVELSVERTERTGALTVVPLAAHRRN